MKRLAMVLGSILVVSAVASAKEVVAQPVIIEEPVMVEKVMIEPVKVEEVMVEPVVMAPAFKPSGSIGLEYRAYGDTEGHGDKISASGVNDEWNRGNNRASRIQTTFSVQATEKFKLVGRIRDYNNLERTDSSRAPGTSGTDTRLRAYYTHSELLTSRLHFRDRTSNNEEYEYQLTATPYRNKGGFLDRIQLTAQYKYSNLAKEDYMNTVGSNLYLTGNLPLGFTWENNYYFNYNMYNNDALAVGVDSNGNIEKKDKEFVIDVEFYLYNTVPLYSGDSYKVNFNFEGGYDAYTIRQYKRVGSDITKPDYGKKTTDKELYSLYTTMDVSVTYSLTEALSLKTGAGAEYRNWDRTNSSSAANWRWQPLAYASMNVKF